MASGRARRRGGVSPPNASPRREHVPSFAPSGAWCSVTLLVPIPFFSR